jgi:SAM-dependent methyltransferase
MGIGFELVTRVNAAARHAGTADAVDQFDNLATHSQYRLPYEITARHVRRGDAVLDWGCGNGHFSLLLAHLGAQVTGFSFEAAPACMAGAPRFTHVRGTEAEPRGLPFPDAAFDCVCSVGVLEHVWETGGDESASLQEIHRILAPGGIFLTFHLPNRFGWVEPSFRALGVRWHFHQRRYGAGDIRRLWNEASLEIVEMGTYNFLPRNKVRALPRRLRRNTAFARLYDGLDRALGAILAPVRTNYYVVGRKRSGAGEGTTRGEDV